MADTIVAIATAPGEAAIAVVRLSGPRSREILETIFRPSGKAPRRPWTMVHGWVVDPFRDRPIDEALAVYMPGPHSYTAEDVVEIHCHGGRLVPRAVMELALTVGARPAQPGELTLRAFLNGRLDLAQAESVLDVIKARTDQAQRLALAGLAGRLSSRISALREELVEVRAHLEASLDFSEEDLPLRDVSPGVERARAAVGELLAGADRGIVVRQGVRTAIVGRPNVGKSSLLNALLRADRAIVTDIPGTTRDTVEETADLGGVPFWLIDTAGLRETLDAVERVGVERSRAALASAALVVLVLDRSEPLAAEDRRLAEEIQDRPVVVAINKMDLPGVIPLGEALRLIPGAEAIELSARTGEGLADLEQAMLRTAVGPLEGQDLAVASPRQKDALLRARAALDQAVVALRDGTPPDVLAGEVAIAVRALGEITGQDATEDLLDAIFSRFCIGK
ncbi:MAG: tRNA uridine-5-carboxymethylaminomethyl(34) synthesis GTPase MnmE [Chloroflexi bacterium]|nr:tRNA uridine-5-carboxymethylaminomethyl(34) synthesis GTPase MnmE [Chloroflexota bacterium]